MSSSSTVGLRSGADTEPLDAELLRERLRARRDARPKLRRLDEHRIAAAREDLALEPFVIAVRAFGERRSVGQPSRAAFGREAGDVLRVENLRRPRITELRRLEAVAGLEMLLRQRRTSHPVEPEGALAIARAVPRVDVPVGQLAAEGVRLDEPARRLGLG